MMNRQRRVRNRVLQGVTALSILNGAASAAMAQTVSMTNVNQCSTTIYTGMTSGNYPNIKGGNGVQNWTLSPQNTRVVVNEWPAPALQYVNLVHNWEGETYTYPYDDWWGLHTVATGANWTITF